MPNDYMLNRNHWFLLQTPLKIYSLHAALSLSHPHARAPPRPTHLSSSWEPPGPWGGRSRRGVGEWEEGGVAPKGWNWGCPSTFLCFWCICRLWRTPSDLVIYESLVISPRPSSRLGVGGARASITSWSWKRAAKAEAEANKLQLKLKLKLLRFRFKILFLHFCFLFHFHFHWTLLTSRGLADLHAKP